MNIHTDATATQPAEAIGTMAQTDAIRIKVTSLTKQFLRRSGKPIIPVNDISLDVAAGEILVLLGPSGCGKTTLLRCIAGLERPDAGRIAINDEVVFSSPDGILLPPNQRPVSMVFQSYALWPHMTVFDNVAYPLRSRGMRGPSVKDRVMQTLDLVGLGQLAGQYPGQISGGQQQRVALARAIVPQTGVVLFDEPLSNIDAKVREQLRTEIVRMQRALGFSAIYVTHDQVEAMAIGDRIAVLNEGHIEQLGPPDVIYRRPASKYVGTFIGSANVIAGTLLSTAGTVARIDTPLGELVADTTDRDTPLPAVGTAVSLLLRPEAIGLSTDRPPADNVIACTIEKRSFLGANVEYAVLAGGEPLQVSTGANTVIAERSSAFLAVPPAAIAIFV